MFKVAINIIKDQDPQSIDECRLRYDWFKWKEAIEIELTSLAKINVFEPIFQTLEDVKSVQYK